MIEYIIGIGTIYSFLNGCGGDDDPDPVPDPIPKSFTFIACEANFGSDNGSIYWIDESKNIFFKQNIGQLPRSLEVYNNKLYVIVSGSNKIIEYNITRDGLLFNQSFNVGDSEPRHMVIIENKIYFTNSKTKDVKVLNLDNTNIKSFVNLSEYGMPEHIIHDNGYLYVTIPYLNKSYVINNMINIVKINIANGDIVKAYEVQEGPQQILISDGNLFITHVSYDESWNTYYATSKVNLANDNIVIRNYENVSNYGSLILKLNNRIYRSIDGGIAELDDDLNIIQNTKIGNIDGAIIYSCSIINEKIYFGLTDYSDVNNNKIQIYNQNNELEYETNVGLGPIDFAYWEE